ncbi:8740_t:CDS:1 [Ambispora gerdemannii]|uniref:8740_t:CDS:1 n=1 Tax=Ambispora gerdemannii TaxID=144530 RepID=A0A9N9HEG8_9GLOM|nr:8740_t:CDS:1 [Ambispora gerdemannii]
MLKTIFAAFLITLIAQFAIINTQAAPLYGANVVKLEKSDYSYGVGSAEKKWCLNPFHTLDCVTAKDLADEALKSAQDNFSNDQLHNGPGDAYRHCYWSGLLTFEFGESEAKGFGDRHEDFPENPSGEKAMDLHNNGVGRTIAQQLDKDGKKGNKAALSTACKQAVSDGRLITKPN